MASRALPTEWHIPEAGAKAKSDRRDTPRVKTVFLAARISRASDCGLFLVKDLSDDGLLFVSQVPFEVGEQVSISLLDSVSLSGTVAWFGDHRCGVRFDAPIDCAAVLTSASAEADRRGRALRLHVDKLATAYAENGIRAVRITDVSRGGIGFSHDGSFRAGMLVKLVLEGGTERQGIVRWANDSHAGLYLIEPLNCLELQSAKTL